MKKRMLAWIMTMCMVLSLLPVSALAVDNGTRADDSGIVFSKTVSGKPDESGAYTLTLEAYATGETTTVPGVKAPLDIALVLDVSGSMDDIISTEYKEVYASDVSTDGNYYVLVDGEYKQAHYAPVREEWFYYYGGLLREFISDPKVNADDSNGTQFYIYEETSKLEALQDAANGFIASVAQDAETYDVTHQIGIVTFSDSSKIEKSLADVSEQESSLKNVINELNAGGSTSADEGMADAQSVLEDARGNAQKVVIMFTDGAPTVTSGFSNSVAANAVNNANSLKAAGATIFTVGVFDDDIDERVPSYMEATSSNYPNAYVEKGIFGVVLNWEESLKLGAKNQDGVDYYLTADSPDSLESIFESIADSISTAPANADLDETTQIVDEISPYFEVGEVDGTPAITVYTADSTDGSGENWDEKTPAPSGVSAELESGVVTVSGYNFAENYVSEDRDDGTYGQKLIIEIKVTPKDVPDPSEDADIPTNGGAQVVLDDKVITEIENSPTVDGAALSKQLWCHRLRTTQDRILCAGRHGRRDRGQTHGQQCGGRGR